MKLIIGLGNPGEKYEQTRHNVGFEALNMLVAYYGIPIETVIKFQSKIIEASLDNQKVLFVKPQTFMNESGSAVQELVNFYKLDVAKDILVIHDDVDLPFGTIRATSSSSHAGQNGVKDIIEKLGTQDFHRIRIGVETRQSREEKDTADFVLSKFTDEELEKLKSDVFPKVRNEVEKFLEM